MKKTVVLFLLVCTFFFYGNAQKFGIKTNMLYLATGTPNLGFELSLGDHATILLSGGWNEFPLDAEGFGLDNRKLKHWLIEPEFRYYFCRPMLKHFIGLHTFYAEYNIGGHEVPFLFAQGSKGYRQQGYMGGVGLEYGYHLILDKRLSLVFDIGLGYSHMNYDYFENQVNGAKLGNINKDYWGLTKLEIALMVLIK